MTLGMDDDECLNFLVNYLSLHDEQTDTNFLVSHLRASPAAQNTAASAAHAGTHDVGASSHAAGAKGDLSDEAGAIYREWRAVTATWSSAAHVAAALRRTEMLVHKIASTVDGDEGLARKQSTAASSAALDAMMTALSPLLEQPPAVRDNDEDAKEKNCVQQEAWAQAYGSMMACSLPVALTLLPLKSISPRRRGPTAAAEHLRTAAQAYALDGTVQDLLRPFVRAIVEPIEKEMLYHYSAGRPTAAAHEPQHFFSFLLDALTSKIPKQVRGFVGADAHASTASYLVSLAQVMLTTTAAALFSETYMWGRDQDGVAEVVSAGGADCDFCVHVVNSCLDFMSHAYARVHVDCLSLLSEHILFPEALTTFFAHGVKTAERAFARGAAALWRRPFLVSSASAATNTMVSSSSHASTDFLLSTRHMIRAVEALMRALSNSLFLVDPSSQRVCWTALVEPTLRAFMLRARAQLPDDDDEAPSWAGAAVECEVLAGIHAVVVAAEDWHSVLSADAAGESFSISWEALDEIALCRDRHVRQCCATVRHLTLLLCDGGDGYDNNNLKSEQQPLPLVPLTALEDYLRFVDAVDCGAAASMLSSTVKETLTERLIPEVRASLCVYLQRMGSRSAAALLEG